MKKFQNLVNYKIVFTIYLFYSFFIVSNLSAGYLSSPVHVIGDSHSMEFSQIPGCQVHWLGPFTMHRVGNQGLSFLHLPDLGVQEGEVVVFAFGEIDVRCHIGKQRDLGNRTLDQVIDDLVHSYLNTILLNRLLYKDLICIVYSVTPPANSDNPAFPSYGTLEDRIAISKKLNERLASACQQMGIEFLDVYHAYATNEGSLNMNYSDGGVHIHPAYFYVINLKLQEILIKLSNE
jgi:hypothetical protein